MAMAAPSCSLRNKRLFDENSKENGPASITWQGRVCFNVTNK
jgi:hypothetical protein